MCCLFGYQYCITLRECIPIAVLTVLKVNTASQPSKVSPIAMSSSREHYGDAIDSESGTPTMARSRSPRRRGTTMLRAQPSTMAGRDTEQVITGMEGGYIAGSTIPTTPDELRRLYETRLSDPTGMPATTFGSMAPRTPDFAPTRAATIPIIVAEPGGTMHAMHDTRELELLRQNAALRESLITNVNIILRSYLEVVRYLDLSRAYLEARQRDHL